MKDNDLKEVYEDFIKCDKLVALLDARYSTHKKAFIGTVSERLERGIDNMLAEIKLLKQK